MSTEDQFTSVQWDRDEVGDNNDKILDSETKPNTIIEEETTGAEDDDTESLGSPTQQALEQATTIDEDVVATKLDDEEVINDDVVDPLTTEGDYQGDDKMEITAHEDNGHIEETPTDVNPEVDEGEPNLFEMYSIDSNVTSPIRDLDTSSKPFISYLITTTTNHPSVLKLTSHKKSDGSESITIKIRRRYGDFRFLHQCLNNDFPTLLIPPIPSKLNFKYLTGDTFSTEFVHKRLHSLNRFIKFILQHKYLSQSSIFHLFISDSTDWATFTKDLKVKELGNDENSSGFVNKVVNEDLITETVMNFLTPSKHKRETNKDILEINDKLKKLYENLLKLDKIFMKLNRKNHDLGVDYEQFLNQIMKLSIINDSDLPATQTAPSTPTSTTPNTAPTSQLTSPLQVSSPSRIISSSTHAIQNNFKIFAESLEYFLKNWSTLHKYIDESFLVSLKDCSKYIISLSNLIELQHNKRIDLQVLQDYLNKAKGELEGMGSGPNSESAHRPPPNPVLNTSSGGIVNSTTQLIKDTLSTSATAHIGSSVNDNKVFKLQSKIEQLESEISIQTKMVQDLTNKIINEEYPNWDKFNKNELKDAMLGLCEEEIKFYKGLVDNWSEVEMKLMKRLDELR